MPRQASKPKEEKAAPKPYADRRMSKKHASSAAKDMRSGSKDAARYMSSYRKHVQIKRSKEATQGQQQQQQAQAPKTTGPPNALPTADQIVPPRPVSSLPRPQ